MVQVEKKPQQMTDIEIIQEVMRKSVSLSPRIKRLKDSYFANEIHIVADRAHLATLGLSAELMTG